MFYGHYHFTVLTGSDLDRFMCPAGAPLLVPEGFVLVSRAAIRFLEIHFVPDTSHMPVDWQKERMSHGSMTRQEWHDMQHAIDKERVRAVWVEAERYLHQFHSLEELTINIRHACCRRGCCKMVGFLAKLMAGFSCTRHGQVPKITIDGALDGKDYQLMMTAVQTGVVLESPDNDDDWNG